MMEMSVFPSSRWPMLALTGIVAFWACDEPRPGISDVPGPAPEVGAEKQQGGQPFDPTDAMTAAIQDEYHAQFTYARVLLDLGGDTGPFDNIMLAEEQHVGAIADLFASRHMDSPESEWDLTNVPSFSTQVEACIGGGQGEIDNIELYDDLLAFDLPQDVRDVFVSLQAASRDHHLPAFEGCSVIGGVEAMDMAIQDEYHAYYTYAKVLLDLGDITPFNSIVDAEAEHVGALAGLYDNRGLPVPASQWDLDNVPMFESRTEACGGGVQGEEENIALYDQLLPLEDLPGDVRMVFEHLRAASLYHHLPAFTLCGT